ncbi:MAG TPA: glutathione S-transferase [Methylophilaceae bacterium]|nr:glutathione S-transferase [Methylophilaceae bacterium]
MQGAIPVLYSYRRCPYAMRARMALRYSDIEVEIREISFKQKPRHMLALSPKGTVPVLVLTDGKVIDESLDIMRWAIEQHDPEQWLLADPIARSEADALIADNDYVFKPVLDKYKYAVRFPQRSAESYRTEGELFFRRLERRLQDKPYLFGDRISLADVAIFPFIRQFSLVDTAWFEQSPYTALQSWLSLLLQTELFMGVMQKYPTWLEAGAG